MELAFCAVMSYGTCDCRPLRTDLTETVERSEAQRIWSMIGVNCAPGVQSVSRAGEREAGGYTRGPLLRRSLFFERESRVSNCNQFGIRLFPFFFFSEQEEQEEEQEQYMWSKPFEQGL